MCDNWRTHFFLQFLLNIISGILFLKEKESFSEGEVNNNLCLSVAEDYKHFHFTINFGKSIISNRLNGK